MQADGASTIPQARRGQRPANAEHGQSRPNESGDADTRLCRRTPRSRRRIVVPPNVPFHFFGNLWRSIPKTNALRCICLDTNRGTPKTQSTTTQAMRGTNTLDFMGSGSYAAGAPLGAPSVCRRGDSAERLGASPAARGQLLGGGPPTKQRPEPNGLGRFFFWMRAVGSTIGQLPGSRQTGNYAVVGEKSPSH